MRRRDVLIAGGVVLGVASLPRIRAAFAPRFEFRDIPSLPGFRRLDTGALSAGPIALVGLDHPETAEIALRDTIRAAPCQAVFRTPGEGVPVAVFSDYNCPNCPEMSRGVQDLLDEGAPITVTWHDLPILGPQSERSARVAIAAGMQGAYLPVHHYLMQAALRPGPLAVHHLAEKFALDGDRLIRDSQSDTVLARIEEAEAAAFVFGLVGTPATIVGRTVILGRMSKQSLSDLIAIEQNSPDFPVVCR